MLGYCLRVCVLCVCRARGLCDAWEKFSVREVVLGLPSGVESVFFLVWKVDKGCRMCGL